MIIPKYFSNLILFLFVPASFFSQKKALMIAEVEYVQLYCGGARPTPEMEEEAKKLRPYANKMIIMVSSGGKVDSVKTNSKGFIKKKVLVGDYKLYEPWRYYKSTPDGSHMNRYDQACMEQEWKKHFMEVSVTKKTVRQVSDGPIVMDCEWNLPCLLEKHLPPMRE